MNKLNIHPVYQDFIKSLEAVLALEKQAQKEYSHCHAQMVDVQHEIELSEGYEDLLKVIVFDHLKEISQERRKHKDTLLISDMLRKMLRGGIELEDLLRLLEDSGKEWSRHYTPRAEKSLDFQSPEKLRESRINRE
ncbi:hypothetical protein Erwinia_phage_Tian_00081 [Erwinia phage Tian]|uniref:Uncharacterized protein n=4 Tax=Kolesnikvirus TaxID=1985293 RepID=A0A6B9RGK4_9CAUD|nr:conserved phage protein [Erwinia phage phiEa21-4]QHI00637.1 hypothetical protein [Salmonella phage vB_SenM_SB18]UFD98381.1 hypothetical protein SPARTY_58 [Hafnia phage vB_HalM_SPARTY]WJN64358.1 hypothetical protein Erwinia_phage_Panisse_00005 [Erwinia phage Panisse]WJN64717.1 hypothetical protein Erwinia_phage_Pistou_00080 [Erwinia phage Pistou]WJN64996.1 hypothetical protein Erwinia_phage_Tian_00081 [Erwinia phage Tian]